MKFGYTIRGNLSWNVTWMTSETQMSYAHLRWIMTHMTHNTITPWQPHYNALTLNQLKRDISQTTFFHDKWIKLLIQLIIPKLLLSIRISWLLLIPRRNFNFTFEEISFYLNDTCFVHLIYFPHIISFFWDFLPLDAIRYCVQVSLTFSKILMRSCCDS